MTTKVNDYGGDNVQRVTTLESIASIEKENVLDHTNTLGSVRLHHVDTNEIILVPQPSSDPNDPLNWYASVTYFNS